MIKHRGISLVAAPRLKQDSCKGCHWYPIPFTRFREVLNHKQQSTSEYLEEGCLKMHEGSKGSLCQDLNIIFVEQ